LGLVELQSDSAGRPFGSLALDVIASNTEQPGFLANLAIGAEGILEFYEVEPGIIAFSGAGRFEAGELELPEDLISSDAGPVWDLYAEGKPRPAALKQALARVSDETRSMAPRGDSPISSGGGAPADDTHAAGPVDKSAELGRLRQAYVGGYCDTDYYTVNEPPFDQPMGDCSGFGWDWGECFDDQSGFSSSSRGRAWRFYVNSCAKIGDHLLTINWREGNWFTVPEETSRWYYQAGTLSEGPTLYTWVDGIGDTFHRRVLVNND
jgi:hypothetical protein